jgi:chromosome segregation ATPase
MATNSDQDDIIAQNERLTTQLAASRQNASELKSQFDSLRDEHTKLKTELAEARSSGATLQQTLDARTKERDGFQAENQSIKTQLADFDKAVAAKIAQMGFSKTALTQIEPKPEDTVNYTDLCRAAKGC